MRVGPLRIRLHKPPLPPPPPVDALYLDHFIFLSAIIVCTLVLASSTRMRQDLRQSGVWDIVWNGMAFSFACGISPIVLGALQLVVVLPINLILGTALSIIPTGMTHFAANLISNGIVVGVETFAGTFIVSALGMLLMRLQDYALQPEHKAQTKGVAEARQPNPAMPEASRSNVSSPLTDEAARIIVQQQEMQQCAQCRNDQQHYRRHVRKRAAHRSRRGAWGGGGSSFSSGSGQSMSECSPVDE